jgi:4-amino-4-deoxy-L-arabinose transferase-like glycosyltransferase
MSLAQASRGWRAHARLLLLCLGLYLPGLASLPVMDRDEARFAQATRQMLESGDYLRISFQDEARNKKPALIYWLQAASVAALSDPASTAIWPYRLPSFLGAILSVWLTFFFGARLVGRAAALLGAALLAASLGLTIEAHLAKTDAVLLALCVAAQGALALIYRSARAGESGGWQWPLLFWVAQGLAILVKGPVAPVLSLLTAFALSIADRDARWLLRLRPLWGVPLVVVIVAPWLVAINRATGGAFLGEAVGQDFFSKLMGAQESHGAPPGYYLVLAAITFWPGSLFLGAAAAIAWRERSGVAVRFLIAWAVPFWLVLECVPTKLPHYILPAYPAVALLAGHAIFAASTAPRWLGRAALLCWVAAALVIASGLMLAPFSLGRGIDVAGIVAGAVILIYGGGMARRAWHGLTPGLAVQAVLLALLVLPVAFALEAPRLDRLWLSRDAAGMVARYRPPRAVPVAAAGYAEPSLVFLLGTATQLVSPETAADRLTSARGAVALVESRDDEAFRRALAARGWSATVVERVAGVDYSNGKRMMLTLYRGVPG